MFFIGLDNFLYKTVSDDIHLAKMEKFYPFNIFQNLACFDESAGAVTWKINLCNISERPEKPLK